MLCGFSHIMYEYLAANRDHYKFDTCCEYEFTRNALVHIWLSEQFIMRHVNVKLIELIEQYKNTVVDDEIPTHEVIHNALVKFGIRTSAFTIYDVGFGEIMIKAYRFDQDGFRTYDELFFLVPRRKIPWKKLWKPGNRVIPAGITII